MGRVIWDNPIYQIEYNFEENNELTINVHDRLLLEEKIKELVEEEALKIQVYNILENVYEFFQVHGTLFSVDMYKSEPIILWGRTEPNDKEIEENYIW
jgi:hypothetical protein